MLIGLLLRVSDVNSENVLVGCMTSVRRAFSGPSDPSSALSVSPSGQGMITWARKPLRLQTGIYRVKDGAEQCESEN